LYIQNLDEVLPLLRAKLREYLTLKLDLRSNAKNFQCFVHNDSDPSMHFNPRTNEETVKCFGCSWHGDLFACAEKIDGLPSSGPEWITETIPTLCELLDIPLKMGDVSVSDRERLKHLKMLQDMADCLIEGSPEKIEYAKQRRWEQPHLSYGCVEEDSLIAAMVDKGWPSEDVVKSGLIRSKYQNWFGPEKLTFIIRDHRGRPIGFIYRDYSKEGGRWVNSSESMVYNKSKALLGIDIALLEARQKGLYVVEGPGDLAQLYRVGITNAVAICGTAFTEHHLLYLKQLGIQRVMLSLDWDKAGFAATARILEGVLQVTSGMSAWVVTAPETDEKDPDELLCNSKTADPFIGLTVLSGFEWRLRQFEDETPDLICEKMIPIIAQEPLAVRRELLIRSLAEYTDINPQAIVTDVRAILDDRFSKFSNRIIATAEQALQEIKEDPESVRSILAEQESRVDGIELEYQQNSIGLNSQLMRLDVLEKETERDDAGGGFEMNNLTNFKNMMDGGSNWAEGCLISIPGRAHSGKTAMGLAISADIAISDENATVLIFSTDDAYKLILPRIMSNIYHFSCPDGPQLYNGMIAQPQKYLPNDDDYRGALYYARDLIKDLIREERLVIIDGEDGRTLGTLEKHQRYYRKRHSARKIFTVIDNQYNLDQFTNLDRSQRAERIITGLKNQCEDYRTCLMATAEYKKRMNGGQEKLVWPEDDDIADSRAQTYRPNVIAHVYNDSRARPDNTEIFWLDGGKVSPRIVLSFTKNKISGRDGKIAFDLSTKTVHPSVVSYEQAYADFERFVENKDAGLVKIQGDQYITVDAEDYDE
jgi:DNA primase catalytic core